MNRNEMIFDLGYKYLMNIGATEEEILRHLNDWSHRKPREINGINGLFYNMVGHAKNRRNMPTTIGEIDRLNEILCDFNPKEVSEKYEFHRNLETKEPWFELQYDIQTELDLWDINTTDGYWVTFSKSIISIAGFLSKFDKISEFNRFVEDFNKNDNTRISLALLLQNEIFGYGFALACDFLKENCNQEYVKPDTHIKYFFNELNLCEEKLNKKTVYKKSTLKNEDIAYYRAVMKYFRSIHELPYNTDKFLPYEVDKLFWLIGSSNFYCLDNKRKKQIKTNRKEFVKFVKSKVDMKNVES